MHFSFNFWIDLKSFSDDFYVRRFNGSNRTSSIFISFLFFIETLISVVVSKCVHILQMNTMRKVGNKGPKKSLNGLHGIGVREITFLLRSFFLEWTKRFFCLQRMSAHPSCVLCRTMRWDKYEMCWVWRCSFCFKCKIKKLCL